MTTSTKIAIGALLFSVVAMVVAYNATPHIPPTLGALGPKLAENYDPYLKYNGGYYSALPIQTTGAFTSGTTTTSGSTNLIKPTFCLNFYATSTATVLHMVASTTPTLPNGANAVITAVYGACS